MFLAGFAVQAIFSHRQALRAASRAGENNFEGLSPGRNQDAGFLGQHTVEVFPEWADLHIGKPGFFQQRGKFGRAEDFGLAPRCFGAAGGQQDASPAQDAKQFL
jgi:hypothetical protein